MLQQPHGTRLQDPSDNIRFFQQGIHPRLDAGTAFVAQFNRPIRMIRNRSGMMNEHHQLFILVGVH
jgi:hypothetical protein